MHNKYIDCDYHKFIPWSENNFLESPWDQPWFLAPTRKYLVAISFNFFRQNNIFKSDWKLIYLSIDFWNIWVLTFYKSIFPGRGSKFTSHKPKKSKFNKIGKYAIAGLAAYGTYKLAKKMSKALRYEYDNDDCWEYLDYSESYSCVCHAECNDYVNSAVSMGISYTLILLSSIFSIISHRILY